MFAGMIPKVINYNISRQFPPFAWFTIPTIVSQRVKRAPSSSRYHKIQKYLGGVNVVVIFSFRLRPVTILKTFCVMCEYRGSKRNWIVFRSSLVRLCRCSDNNIKMLLRDIREAPKRGIKQLFSGCKIKFVRYYTKRVLSGSRRARRTDRLMAEKTDRWKWIWLYKETILLCTIVGVHDPSNSGDFVVRTWCPWEMFFTQWPRFRAITKEIQ